MWGTIVSGQYLPVGFTYVFAFVTVSLVYISEKSLLIICLYCLQMFVFHIPFLLGISELVHNRYLNAFKLKQQNQQQKQKNNKLNGSNCLGVCNYFSLLKAFVIVIAILLALTSTIFYFAYGFLALVFNVFTWTSVAYFALIFMGVRLDERHFPLSKTNNDCNIENSSSTRLIDANAKQ